MSGIRDLEQPELCSFLLDAVERVHRRENRDSGPRERGEMVGRALTILQVPADDVDGIDWVIQMALMGEPSQIADLAVILEACRVYSARADLGGA